MKFLVISQRAKGNPNFPLNDTAGHGRFDVVIRCILAAVRELTPDSLLNSSEIFTFLKGGEVQGWLHFNSGQDLGDEASAAVIIKNNWQQYWHDGSLSDLLTHFPDDSIWIELAEDGSSLDTFFGFCDKDDLDKMVVILGAQQDLTEEDKHALSKKITSIFRVSLGDVSLLASQAISMFRIGAHKRWAIKPSL